MTLRGVLTGTRRHTARVLSSLTCDQYASNLHGFCHSLSPCRESPVAVDSAAQSHQQAELHSATSCGTSPTVANQHELPMRISSQTCGRPSGWHSQRANTAWRPSVQVPHQAQWRELCSSALTAAASHLCSSSSTAAGVMLRWDPVSRSYGTGGTAITLPTWLPRRCTQRQCCKLPMTNSAAFLCSAW